MPASEARAALKRKVRELMADLDKVQKNPLVTPDRVRIATELSRQLHEAILWLGDDDLDALDPRN